MTQFMQKIETLLINKRIQYMFYIYLQIHVLALAFTAATNRKFFYISFTSIQKYSTVFSSNVWCFDGHLLYPGNDETGDAIHDICT